MSIIFEITKSFRLISTLETIKYESTFELTFVLEMGDISFRMEERPAKCMKSHKKSN